MNSKESIAVVWLKRDLRLDDNESIYRALESGQRVLLLYVFENLLLNDMHYSERHFNFIKESLRDINTQLKPYGTKVLVDPRTRTQIYLGDRKVILSKPLNSNASISRRDY